MLRITLKSVRGHVLRFVLTLASVTLGTALVAGTYVLTDSINATFDKIFDSAAAGLDVQVRGVSKGASFQGAPDLRQPLPTTLVSTLRDVKGVARAVPDFQGSAVLVGKDGTAVRSGGAPTLAFAFYEDDPAIKVVRGRGPALADEIAVETSTLRKSGFSVGDHTRALVGGNPQDVTIVGEVKFDAGLAGATLVVIDPKTAATVFAPDGTVQSFSLEAAKGVTPEQLRTDVAAVLPDGAEAVTGKTTADENKKALRSGIGFITVLLLVFAAVSLLVGGFIIFNTFRILISQRTRELALLRAVGAARRQVLGVVLGEAAVVGFVGGLLGLAVGIGLAIGLQAVFGAIGLEISGGLPVLPRTVAVTLVAGVAVTVAAATFPALRASRIAPVAAMRDDLVTAPKGVRRLGLIGLSVIAVGVAVFVAVLAADTVNWWGFLVGALLVVGGSMAAAPLATRPVVRAVAAPIVPFAGVVARLARENALRVPRRTAITAGALMIGLALITVLSVVASSANASVADLVDKQLTADFVLNGGQAPFPPTVADHVSGLPGVASVATIGIAVVQVGKDNLTAIAGESRGISDNVKVEMPSGSLAALDSGKVLVNSSTAKARGWKVGTTFTATFGTLADQQMTVGGVFKDNQVLGAPIIVPRELYKKAIPAALQGDFLVYVKAKPGTDLSALRAELVTEVKPYLVVSVQDGAEFTDSQASQVNTLLSILYLLVALSVVIALLGVINTLALSVFERTREIGLLRAVGLSRRQLSGSITIEAVTTAVFGALLGTVLGLGLGIALQRALRDQGLEVLAIPWSTLITVIVAAAVAGVVAAVLPAIRAVRMDVLRAITTE